MIPAKECKLLTFQLMENNFISLQELRKSMVPTAPSKAVYLFYVNLDAAVRFTVGLCLRSLINVKTRLELEGRDNERLVEKEEKVQTILQDLRAESAEQAGCRNVNLLSWLFLVVKMVSQETPYVNYRR